MLFDLVTQYPRVTQSKLRQGERVWSFVELSEQVSQWHDRLERHHAKVVAFLVPNSLEWVALDLALLQSGMVAVPIPAFFSESQRQHLLKASGADLFVCHESFQSDGLLGEFSTLSPSSFQGHYFHPILITDTESSRNALPGRTAKITFTSGSTGAPKGACLSRETLWGTASALVDALQPLGLKRHLSVLPLTLLLENVAGLYANLINGSEILLPDLADMGMTGSSGLDVSRFLQALQSTEADSVIFVPQLLLAVTAGQEMKLCDLRQYKFIAVGGGKVAPSLLHRASEQSLSVYEGYGLTECCGVVALNTPAANKPGTVGQMLNHVEYSICDGELIVQSPSFLGYLDSDATGDSVRTGDLVQQDSDGFLSISGRLKNVFVTAFGRNCSPEWIESELQSELAINVAVVFGEALSGNIALVIVRDGMTPQAVDSAVAGCNARLPDYARITDWRAISMDEFRLKGCLTANGRPKRAVIEAEYVSDLATMSQSQAPQRSKTNAGL